MEALRFEGFFIRSSIRFPSEMCFYATLRNHLKNVSDSKRPSKMEVQNAPRFDVPPKMEVQNAPRFGVPPKMEVQNAPRLGVPPKMEV